MSPLLLPFSLSPPPPLPFSPSLLLSSQLYIDMHNNRAACQQQLGNWRAVIEDSSVVLEQQPDNLKALKRRCLGWDEQEKYGLGLTDCRRYVFNDLS